MNPRMLLVADVGNTDTVFGLYEREGKGSPARVWRAESNPRRTADEWAALIGRLLEAEEHHLRDVDDLVIASVVPDVTRALSRLAETHIGHAPLVVTAESDLGIAVEVDRPAEVGADRVVNCLAALAKWKAPLVCVDLGTATTFDVVSKKGAFAGGMIVPGPNTFLQALAARTAKLPALPVARTETVIGKSTQHAMQAGAFWGYVDLVEGLLARIAKELGAKPTVIATGGWAQVVGPACRSIDHFEPELTVEGLRLAWERLTKGVARAKARGKVRGRPRGA